MSAATKFSSLRKSGFRTGLGWTGGAAAIGAFVGRVGPGFPVWAWSTSGIIAVAVSGAVLSPIAALGGLVILKQSSPQTVTTLVLSAVFAIVALLAGGWRRLPPAPAIMFGLFALIALPSIHLHEMGWDHIKQFDVPGTDWEVFPFQSYDMVQGAQLLGTASLAALAGLAVRKRADLDLFMTALLFGAAIPILIGLKDRVTGNLVYHDGAASIQSLFTHPNAFACYLVIVIPVLFANAFSARNLWTRRASAVIGCMGVLCLLFTYTRSGWIALVLGGVVGAVLARQTKFVVVVGISAIAIGTVTGLAAPVTQRLTATGSEVGSSSSSLKWRTRTWSAVLHDTQENGITGIGFGHYESKTVEVFGLVGGNTPTNLTPGGRRGFGAHNDFVESYVETGIPGLLLWTGFLGSLLFTAGRLFRRFHEPLALGGFVGVLGLTIMSTSDNVQAYDYSWMIAFGVIAAVYALTRTPGETFADMASDVEADDGEDDTPDEDETPLVPTSDPHYATV